MDVEVWSDTATTEVALLGLSVLLCGIVGLERQISQKSAGIRTHTLVGMGSAGFTLVSAFGFSNVLGEATNLDPSRIAAQIVSGVGFLGAGVIFMRRDVVRGLTTAATIWVSAAIGMACGAGMVALAVAMTLFQLLALVVLAPLGQMLPTSSRNRTIDIRYLDGARRPARGAADGERDGLPRLHRACPSGQGDGHPRRVSGSQHAVPRPSPADQPGRPAHPAERRAGGPRAKGL